MPTDANEPTIRPLGALGPRVRFLSCGMAVVMVVAWVAALWPLDDLLDRNGTPVGGDFPMFYVAGQTYREGRLDELYRADAQQRRLHELLPNLAPDYTLPYRYPPPVAAAASLLTRLPYPAAWAVFALLSVAAWAIAATVAIRTWGVSPLARKTMVWCALGLPVAWEVVLGGQASHFGLLLTLAADRKSTR